MVREPDRGNYLRGGQAKIAREQAQKDIESPISGQQVTGRGEQGKREDSHRPTSQCLCVEKLRKMSIFVHVIFAISQ